MHKKGWTWIDSIEKRNLKKYLPKKCFICGSKKKLEIHHVLPRRFGGNDEIDNMTMLCDDCHKKLHKVENKNIDWYKRLEMLKRRFERRLK